MVENLVSHNCIPLFLTSETAWEAFTHYTTESNGKRVGIWANARLQVPDAKHIYASTILKPDQTGMRRLHSQHREHGHSNLTTPNYHRREWLESTWWSIQNVASSTAVRLAKHVMADRSRQAITCFTSGTSFINTFPFAQASNWFTQHHSNSNDVTFIT